MYLTASLHRVRTVRAADICLAFLLQIADEDDAIMIFFMFMIASLPAQYVWRGNAAAPEIHRRHLRPTLTSTRQWTRE